jgi:hypothetical protein
MFGSFEGLLTPASFIDVTPLVEKPDTSRSFHILPAALHTLQSCNPSDSPPLMLTKNLPFAF